MTVAWGRMYQLFSSVKLKWLFSDDPLDPGRHISDDETLQRQVQVWTWPLQEIHLIYPICLNKKIYILQNSVSLYQDKASWACLSSTETNNSLRWVYLRTIIGLYESWMLLEQSCLYWHLPSLDHQLPQAVVRARWLLRLVLEVWSPLRLWHHWIPNLRVWWLYHRYWVVLGPRGVLTQLRILQLRLPWPRSE